MSNEIGYGAAAIKAGEVKYQQALTNLVKEAGKKPEADAATVSKTAEHVGKNIDVRA